MDIQSNQPKLIHLPLGEEHPYQPLPIERSPRQPLAGQPVEMGVAVYPMDALTTVILEWWREGETYREQAAAQPAGLWDEGSLWKTCLPAFMPGEKIHYQFTGLKDGERITSAIYTFSTAAWHSLQSLAQVELIPAGVDLIAKAENSDLKATLRLAPQPDGSVRLNIRVGSETPAASADVVAGSPYRVTLENEDEVYLEGGSLQIRVRRSPLRLEFLNSDGELLLGEAAPGSFLIDGDGRLLEWQQTFTSPSDEAFYGFGERFNALNQRGSSLDVCVYNQWLNQGRKTYIPVPFFLSSRHYGLYIDTSRYLAFDLAESQPDRWSFRAEFGQDASLSLRLAHSRHPVEIISWFSGLTGKPTLPPDWTFGLWVSGNDWNSQAKVERQLELAEQHQIPATVFVIEAWSDEVNFYIWNDARYTPKLDSAPFSYADFDFPKDGLWPNPQAMIDRMHAQGMRLILWQIPVLKHLQPHDVGYGQPQPQHDVDEKAMIARGYCVRTPEGESYRASPRAAWFQGSLVLDPTNPEALCWWLDKRAYLLEEMGVDGFKTDGGEHIWGRDLRFADGRKSDELLNEYPALYEEAYYRFSTEHRRGGAVLFSRAGFTGSQKSPCHWAGDEASTWEAFRASILAGLSAGISGIPFWGWDIAGFSGEIPPAELYLRAAAMSVFCPIMQYHSEYNGRREPSRDRTPWNIQELTGDKTVIPAFRFFANLRMNLFPYIAGEARFCSQTGLPMMRALPLDFPDDLGCRDVPYQYLFGRELLVAPVVQAGQDEQEVYLPDGSWYDFWQGGQLTGGRVMTVDASRERIAVFVRAGSVLPLNLGDSITLGSPVGNAVEKYHQLVFVVYPREGSQSYTWQDPLSGLSYKFEMRYDPDRALLEIEIPAMAYLPAIHVPANGLCRVKVNPPGPAPEVRFRNQDSCIVIPSLNLTVPVHLEMTDYHPRVVSA